MQPARADFGAGAQQNQRHEQQDEPRDADIERQCVNVRHVLFFVHRQAGALVQALQGLGLAYTLNPGEGAFYGPKLEFVLRDAIGRDWQCGTLQVDMNLPERFDIDYVGEDSQRRRPVMLHRALFGSLERFTGILLEHYAGKLPAWLAPVQVSVLSITEAHASYALSVAQALRKSGIRAHLDVSNEKIGYKIREQTLQRISYLIVVGAEEMAHGTVTLRTHAGENLGTLALADCAQQLKTLIGDGS